MNSKWTVLTAWFLHTDFTNLEMDSTLLSFKKIYILCQTGKKKSVFHAMGHLGFSKASFLMTVVFDCFLFVSFQSNWLRFLL